MPTQRESVETESWWRASRKEPRASSPVPTSSRRTGSSRPTCTWARSAIPSRSIPGTGLSTSRYPPASRISMRKQTSRFLNSSFPWLSTRQRRAAVETERNGRAEGSPSYPSESLNPCEVLRVGPTMDRAARPPSRMEGVNGVLLTPSPASGRGGRRRGTLRSARTRRSCGSRAARSRNSPWGVPCG